MTLGRGGGSTTVSTPDPLYVRHPAPRSPHPTPKSTHTNLNLMIFSRARIIGRAYNVGFRARRNVSDSGGRSGLEEAEARAVGVPLETGPLGLRKRLHEIRSGLPAPVQLGDELARR